MRVRQSSKFSPVWKRAKCTDVDDATVKHTTWKRQTAAAGRRMQSEQCRKYFWLSNWISSNHRARVWLEWNHPAQCLHSLYILLNDSWRFLAAVLQLQVPQRHDDGERLWSSKQTHNLSWPKKKNLIKAKLNVTILTADYAASGMKENLTVLESLQESRLILSSVVLPCSQQVSRLRHADSTSSAQLLFFPLIKWNVKMYSTYFLIAMSPSCASWRCSKSPFVMTQPHTVSSQHWQQKEPEASHVHMEHTHMKHLSGSQVLDQWNQPQTDRWRC